jgi:hypothetical protein
VPCEGVAAVFVTNFVPLAARNAGGGKARGGMGRTQIRETTSETALSTRFAYPLS